MPINAAQNLRISEKLTTLGSSIMVVIDMCDQVIKHLENDPTVSDDDLKPHYRIKESLTRAQSRNEDLIAHYKKQALIF